MRDLHRENSGSSHKGLDVTDSSTAEFAKIEL